MLGNVAPPKLRSLREITTDCDGGGPRPMAFPNCLASWAKGSECCTSMSVLASLTNLFSGGDLLLILLVILLLFGAKKLPELARGMGQAIKEFQKAKDEFTD